MNSYAHHGLLPTNIPLHCNICPKKPDFSDVSHLLTHIASKGHLSHYYKMKVTASTELESQLVVAEYDEWYDEWNVQELMRERMNQKERKQVGSNRNGSRRPSAANSLASNTARNTPIPAPRAPRRPSALRESTLDPQLDRIIKQEPKSRSTTPAVPFAMDPATASRTFEPPMQAWSPFVDSPLTQETSTFDSLYNIPTTDSFEEEMPAKKPARGRKKGRNLSGSHQSVEMDGEVDYDPINDKLTLKGVIWPGMDLFDSATVDMKRKRNQKKDQSVLENLMANSEVIEPTEVVYDADIVLQRERTVTGNPNEDDGFSPLPGEESPDTDSTASPKPKKKRAPRKPRAPLAKKDANTGRARGRRRGESHHPPFGNTTRCAPYFDGGADEDDDELTYGRQRASRRGLSIHRDNSGPEITFEQPVSMEVLTSKFPNPFQRAPTLQPHPDSMIQNGYATDGRRNGQPAFSMPGIFRTVRQNPAGHIQPPNFGTFGQLSGFSTWANPSFQNQGARMPVPAGVTGGVAGGMPVCNGQSAFSTFEPQFPPNNVNGVQISSYQGMNNSSFQIPTVYDVFDATNPNVSGPSLPADSSFSMNAELALANPLFFSSTHNAPEDDDQATLSPPHSERSARFSGGR